MQRSLLRVAAQSAEQAGLRGSVARRAGVAGSGFRGRSRRKGFAGRPQSVRGLCRVGGEPAGYCGTSADDAEKLSGRVAGPEEGAGAGLSGKIRKNIRRACGAVRRELCGAVRGLWARLMSQPFARRGAERGASGTAGECCAQGRSRGERIPGPESKKGGCGAAAERAGAVSGRRDMDIAAAAVCKYCRKR